MKATIFKAILILFGGVALYFVIRSILPENVSTELSTNFGILGFLGAVLAWFQGLRLEWMQKSREERMNERIDITLRFVPEDGEPAVDHRVPHRPRRGDFSRADLQGILRTVERDSDHLGEYKLKHLEKAQYTDDIARISDPDSKIREIVIPYSDKQFKWDEEPVADKGNGSGA